MQGKMTSVTCQQSFLRPKRRGSDSSVSSTDSWLSRGSTISNASSCFLHSLSILGLPLELELSIMGTVDQSILDRALVAQDRRARGCSSSKSLQSSCQNYRRRITNILAEEDDEIRSVNGEGIMSTTLCSTEL